ncbi:DUF1573 domain-containing protein [Candidatus Daviesbacteria bacterium]|nr:DUF1573 domain-containing protein [Candidatus Daviesbacteria bacterium]
MNTTTKIVIAIVIFSAVLVGGAAYFLAGSSSSKPVLEKTTGAKLETPELSFDFKDIAFGGGIVTHAFPIKNLGDKDLQIANMATSCMCTKVFLKTQSSEGPRAGMKGMSKQNSWTGTLKPGEVGEIVAEFDPAFHGPSGVGPVDRVVSFETNDPDKPYIELSFKGIVKK